MAPILYHVVPHGGTYEAPRQGTGWRKEIADASPSARDEPAPAAEARRPATVVAAGNENVAAGSGANRERMPAWVGGNREPWNVPRCERPVVVTRFAIVGKDRKWVWADATTGNRSRHN